MKKTVRLLAPLASVKAQEKYIVNASVDEYYVPEELLEAALSALLHEEDTELVQNLLNKLRNFSFPNPFSAQELIHEYEPWAELRSLCQEFLKSKGFDLTQWEQHKA